MRTSVNTQMHCFVQDKVPAHRVTFGFLFETEFKQPAKQGEKYWTPSPPQRG
jgi:hypothetical protein